jgi:hypothetical protein
MFIQGDEEIFALKAINFLFSPDALALGCIEYTKKEAAYQGKLTAKYGMAILMLRDTRLFMVLSDRSSFIQCGNLWENLA